MSRLARVVALVLIVSCTFGSALASPSPEEGRSCLSFPGAL